MGVMLVSLMFVTVPVWSLRLAFTVETLGISYCGSEILFQVSGGYGVVSNTTCSIVGVEWWEKLPLGILLLVGMGSVGKGIVVDGVSRDTCNERSAMDTGLITLIVSSISITF